MNQEHKRYLDDLRKKGKVNMYYATPFLVGKFGIDSDEARKILKEWMTSFE